MLWWWLWGGWCLAEAGRCCLGPTGQAAMAFSSDNGEQLPHLFDDEARAYYLLDTLCDCVACCCCAVLFYHLPQVFFAALLLPLCLLGVGFECPACCQAGMPTSSGHTSRDSSIERALAEARAPYVAAACCRLLLVAGSLLLLAAAACLLAFCACAVAACCRC